MDIIMRHGRFVKGLRAFVPLLLRAISDRPQNLDDYNSKQEPQYVAPYSISFKIFLHKSTCGTGPRLLGGR